MTQTRSTSRRPRRARIVETLGVAVAFAAIAVMLGLIAEHSVRTPTTATVSRATAPAPAVIADDVIARHLDLRTGRN